MNDAPPGGDRSDSESTSPARSNKSNAATSIQAALRKWSGVVGATAATGKGEFKPAPHCICMPGTGSSPSSVEWHDPLAHFSTGSCQLEIAQ